MNHRRGYNNTTRGSAVMKWKECQEILKLYPKLVAFRLKWPNGIRISLFQENEEWVAKTEISSIFMEKNKAEDTADLLLNDLSWDESKNYDWVVA
jgi:hypothetical protein